ncbi:MAG: anthranilate phosphoribosyltransferase [Desulfuromonadales bacterium]|jgi:anthranilate phosphoribosyltransferase|nr:anthranilate phosphoribosyltransferase [Desulfuromonadales bacterium]MDH3807585.1 anthranilate phosphoribosyltransferase [Desulfuromonadales bacterium]MDH3868305.1 anthranilate phosphoribosyltransferase [Desulfuromonadales bacterium]MDH4024289.1 anthranilate phosphoribosyltransferase [Desulfuromonadales bacterium]HKJ29708.1 anthranilate phosphoribosyltransferase [Desulfuromonadales bacterium]
MIKDAISKVVLRQDLLETEMIEVMNQIMGGEATPAQVGAFITALRMKGETIEEITGAARVMRDHATPIRVGKALDIDREEINLDRETVLDTCGTGGSGTKSFNISTTVAFVVSACGAKVAKHGNRSISSACGSADVLEALGVNLNVTPEQVESCINEVGVGFLFAPALHGAMKHAIGPRREIGIRTIFNILGPLTNPAGADRQVLGVYDEKLVEVLAKVLVKLGCQRGFVVHGQDGMDEITLTGPTRIAEINEGKVALSTIEPEDFGLRRCLLTDLQGGDAEENAAIVKDVLAGAEGPKRDVVLLNAAYALIAAGIVESVDAGLQKARNVIDEGLAKAKLEGLVNLTNA